jgi:cobalt-zinc-cadmium efflux system membrane fusion protein
MFASLQVARPSASVIVVPASAVLHEGSTSLVYVQGSDGKYSTRTVNTGASRGNDVEITSGLRDGERVVRQGAAFLRAPVGD